MVTSKNSEIAQMQGTGKILAPANLKVSLLRNFVLPRHICIICKQEIFIRNAAVGMKWGKQAIREADARRCEFLGVS